MFVSMSVINNVSYSQGIVVNFPALFQPQPGGGFTVTFRDVPEAITQGDLIEEAKVMALEALLTAMEFYVREGRLSPMPSSCMAGEHMVSIPPSAVAKLELLNEMVRQGIKPSELARRLKASPQTVNRLLNLQHTSAINNIDEALRVLGRRLSFTVESL
jgi:antitoxin HicB